jgi:hypothetical protein
MKNEEIESNKLKQNISLHLSNSPSLRINQNKRNSKVNLLPTQQNQVKLEKNVNNVSPKFNLNF